jgi:mono/diheme cytochrome c family protein
VARGGGEGAVSARPWLWLALVAGCDPAAPASTAPSSTGAGGSAVAPTPSAGVRDAATAAAERASLDFAIDGKPLRSLRQGELTAAIGTETWTAYDPYYNKPKTFRALPLRPVLERGFEGAAVDLEASFFVLRAKDGYTVPIDGKRLLEQGGYIAIDDVDVAGGWQPIGPGQVDPAPFYLVWRKDEQRDLTTHPRPWQLVAIEITRFEATFPKTVPTGEPAGSPAMAGFAIFREQCIRCHAINQQGGRVGPDLNVPRSIVEYRPADQIRAYIRDPLSFRYGNMPAHKHLSDADLDGLVAYLEAMSKRKDDPGPGSSH